MTNYYVYEVERIFGYKNTAETLDHDYTADFYKSALKMGGVITGFFITDSRLQVGEVYFTGELIKVRREVANFEAEPIHYVCV